VVIGSLFLSVTPWLLSNGRYAEAVQLTRDAASYLQPGLANATPEYLVLDELTLGTSRCREILGNSGGRALKKWIGSARGTGSAISPIRENIDASNPCASCFSCNCETRAAGALHCLAL
jgi:hypothetical protein